METRAMPVGNRMLATTRDPTAAPADRWPDHPHLAAACVAILARTGPNARASGVLLPELDGGPACD